MEHSEELVIDHVQRITTLEDKVRVVESVTTNISTSLDKVTKEISAIKWLTAGEPLKMSTGEALTKAVLGANPQRVAREQDIRDSVLTMQKTYEDRINNLKERVKRGKQGWTPEFNKEFYQLKEQIRKYNLPIKATKQLRRPRVDRRYKSSIKTYDYISGGE